MSGLTVQLRQKLSEDPVAFLWQRRQVKLTTRDGHEVTLQRTRAPKRESYSDSGLHFRVKANDEDLTFVNPYNALAYINFLDRQAENAKLREDVNIFFTLLD